MMSCRISILDSTKARKYRKDFVCKCQEGIKKRGEEITVAMVEEGPWLKRELHTPEARNMPLSDGGIPDMM